jgi:hypothetical protein
MNTNLNKPIDFNNLNNENNFPVEVLPEPFRTLVIDLKESLNFPIDYTGIGILTAVSTAIGTSAKVKVKNKWYEYPSLYACLIGNAGTSKTHPIKMVFDPFYNHDKLELNKYNELFKAYEEFQNLNKKDKDQRPTVEKPPLVKTILTNFTPEVLNQRLNDNPRGCSVISDEIATFLEGMNNYSKSDQASTFLSIYNNQPICIDRASSPKPLFIKCPYLNIIGGLQPRILKKVFPCDKLNNGFIQRFLFAFPTSSIKEPINDNEISSELLNQYNDFLLNYIKNNPVKINEETGNIDSKIYYWSDEAKTFWHNWQSENCLLVNENQESVKGEIITKYDNHFVRLALILQIMENYNTYEIGINAVKGAAKLCTYFMNCAFKVLDIIQNVKTNADFLPTNKKEFYNELPPVFTTEIALNIGLSKGIATRTVKDFLNDQRFFERVTHGNYKKLIN